MCEIGIKLRIYLGLNDVYHYKYEAVYYILLTYGVIKILGVGTCFYVFESSSYVPRLHLFVQNTVKTVIIQNIITIENNSFFYFILIYFKIECIPVIKKLIVLAPVISVT